MKKTKKEVSKRTKEADEIYCHSCGEPIKKEAEICVHCGVRQKEIIRSFKNKTTAILLAIFFSSFTWLYTWKVDYWKFWIALAISFTLGWVLFWFLIFAIWIWAIVDVARRPQSFYESF